MTFDESIPCANSGFELAGDDELGQSIFEKEEDNADEGAVVVDDDEIGQVPADLLVRSTSTTFIDGPDTTSTTPGHQHEPLHDQVEEEIQEEPAEVEGEATSERQAPRHIQ